MRKNKRIVITGLCVLIIGISVASTPKKNKNSDVATKSAKEMRSFGLNDFVKMDMELIAHFPTRRHWTAIDENILKIPVESMRYIDSMDIRTTPDTLFVRVYTQNFVYRSQNIYKIVTNLQTNDSLIIRDFDVDLKMKENIDDAETFRRENFTMDYLIKRNIANTDTRIIFRKIFS